MADQLTTTIRARSSSFFSSQTSRPSLPQISQRSPLSAADHSESVTSIPTSHSASNTAIDYTTINARWLEVLNQYYSFHLHSSRSSFKRLLRDLHSNTDEPPRTSLSDGGSSSQKASPWTLPTDQIALLFTNIALIHAYLGSYHLASAGFREAVELDEKLAVAWYGLGIAHFYLKELGASKKAFTGCLTCFVAEEEGEKKYLRDDLTFNTWIPPNDDSQQKDDHSLTGEIADALRGICHQNSPAGEWKLERARVDWNWRIALFERNWAKRGVTRPGGGKWGLNGLPVGVMFGVCVLQLFSLIVALI